VSITELVTAQPEMPMARTAAVESKSLRMVTTPFSHTGLVIDFYTEPKDKFPFAYGRVPVSLHRLTAWL
jgi:hypothetical protein